MREKLKDIEGRRVTVQATFVRFGSKPAYRGMPITTILLEDITEREKTVCDHLWFTMTKGFENLDLMPGDRIQFDGRVKEYSKGYRGYRDDYDLPEPSYDYKLSHPTKIIKIEKVLEMDLK